MAILQSTSGDPENNRFIPVVCSACRRIYIQVKTILASSNHIISRIHRRTIYTAVSLKPGHKVLSLRTVLLKAPIPPLRRMDGIVRVFRWFRRLKPFWGRDGIWDPQELVDRRCRRRQGGRRADNGGLRDHHCGSRCRLADCMSDKRQ